MVNFAEKVLICRQKMKMSSLLVMSTECMEMGRWWQTLSEMKCNRMKKRATMRTKECQKTPTQITMTPYTRLMATEARSVPVYYLYPSEKDQVLTEAYCDVQQALSSLWPGIQHLIW